MTRFFDFVQNDFDDENARRLASDAAIHGVNFTDVTGRRIDPNSIRPSSPGVCDGSGWIRRGTTHRRCYGCRECEPGLAADGRSE